MSTMIDSRNHDSYNTENASVMANEKGPEAREDLGLGAKPTLPPPSQLMVEEEKGLCAKIDLRLMPIFSLKYLCPFLDRGKQYIPILLHPELTHRSYFCSSLAYYYPTSMYWACFHNYDVGIR